VKYFKVLIVVAVILFIAVLIFGREKSPDWVIKQFLTKDRFTEQHLHMTDDFKPNPKGLTIRGDIPKNVSIEYKKLEQTKERAIYSIYLSDGKSPENWYMYLRKVEGFWKLSRMRALAGTGIHRMYLKELNSKKELSKKEEWELKNIKLILSDDDTIKEHLRSNIEIFDNLISEYKKNSKSKSLSKSKLNELKKKVYLSNAYNLKHYENVIALTIGGMADNSVGYFYVENEEDVPPMEHDYFIYIEKIFPGWYIFKKT
jgi:hypothetical protein